MMAASIDLKNWSTWVELDFGNTPAEHLYNNNLSMYEKEHYGRGQSSTLRPSGNSDGTRL